MLPISLRAPALIAVVALAGAVGAQFADARGAAPFLTASRVQALMGGKPLVSG